MRWNPCQVDKSCMGLVALYARGRTDSSTPHFLASSIFAVQNSANWSLALWSISFRYSGLPALQKVIYAVMTVQQVLCAEMHKFGRIVGHGGAKSTGAKGYICPSTSKITGANSPLPLWVRRLWLQRSQRSILLCGQTGVWWDKCLHEFGRYVEKWNLNV